MRERLSARFLCRLSVDLAPSRGGGRRGWEAGHAGVGRHVAHHEVGEAAGEHEEHEVVEVEVDRQDEWRADQTPVLSLCGRPD